jgi:DNA (cytosine-5)-methyltransferase 1
MVGNRLGIDFKFPEKHTTKVTVDEAISDLPSLQNGEMLEEAAYTLSLEEASEYERLMREGSDKARQNYVSRNNDLVIERYKYIGQGQNLRAIPDHLMQNYADKGRCHSGIYKRLRADQPSVVISNYCKSMLIHPTKIGVS